VTEALGAAVRVDPVRSGHHPGLPRGNGRPGNRRRRPLLAELVQGLKVHPGWQFGSDDFPGCQELGGEDVGFSFLDRVASHRVCVHQHVPDFVGSCEPMPVNIVRWSGVRTTIGRGSCEVEAASMVAVAVPANGTRVTMSPR